MILYVLYVDDAFEFVRSGQLRGNNIWTCEQGQKYDFHWRSLAMSYFVACVSYHRGPKKMSDAKIVPLIQSPLQGKQACPIYPHSHQHCWTCSSKATIICHSCWGTILISRAILPLHLPCRGVGQDVGVRDEKRRGSGQ